MPVTFEPAAPLAPDVTANAGRAEIMTRDYPTLAGLYHAGMQARSQAQIAQAQINQQGAIAQANRTQQGIESEAQLGQQAAQFQQQRQPSQRDVFEAQQQQQLQQQSVQQQAELRAWLNQQELSQQEKMDLSRMQNGLGYIEQQHAAGAITDQDAVDMSLQLKTRIDPLKQRVERSRAQQEQVMTQKAMEDIARQEAITKERDALWAKYAKDGIAYIPDSEGNVQQYSRNRYGEITPLKPSGGTTPEAKQAAQPFDWGKAEKQATELAELAMPDFSLKGEPLVTDKAAHDAWKQQRQEFMEKKREYMREAVYDHNATSKNPVLRYDLEPASVKDQFQTTYGDQAEAKWKQEHAATLQSARGSRNAPPLMQAPGAAQQQVVGAAPPPVQPQAQQPFPLTEWREKASPVQQLQMGKLAELRAGVEEAKGRMPEKEHQAVTEAIDWVANVLANNGRLDHPGLTAEQKAKTAHALDVIARTKEVPMPKKAGVDYSGGQGGVMY